jgi:hypothetical protein
VGFITYGSGCGIKVGNPDTDEPTKTNAALDVSIASSGDFSFDGVGLNLAGLKIIRANETSQSLSFSFSKTITMSAADSRRKRNLLEESVAYTGDYRAIRIMFEKQKPGYVNTATGEVPIETPAERSYIDIPTPFSLNPGRTTRLVVLFVPSESLTPVQEGEKIVSYKIGDGFGAEVDESGESEGEDQAAFKKGYKSYRLVIKKVNEGNRVELSGLSFRITGIWQDNNFLEQTGTIGPFNATVSESSAKGDSDKAWRAMGARKWSSAEVFDEDSGEHENGEYEYIQVDFDESVMIDGFQFRGTGSSRCPELFHLEADNFGDWQILPDSEMNSVSCDPAIVTW